MHKGHNHAAQNGGPYENGLGHGTGREPIRTTSAFTTSGSERPEPNEPSSQLPTGADGTGWGGDAGFGAPGSEQGGFGGQPTGNDNGSSGLGRPAGAAKRTGSSNIEEEVTVNLLEEKEGMFMFQHRNYEVVSVRKNSKVVRRYSDFVWLLDCLYKRYPFRQLPLLPPKRVASKSATTIMKLEC